ncbi:MAG TPA: LysM peptidoglycan-binding domain-containing protein [Acidobacteriaceae bacterium]|nr:LysM peptidoglycan-binding domain-containing protein [Acidobacteriaceae bacterium]
MLTGCPQQQKTSANSIPANAVAPTVAPSTPAAVAAQPAPEPKPQPPQDAAHDRAVQQLIERAESAYNSGVQNYRGQRLEAARADFDRAVDMMLTSGMDLKSDAQLSDEFDKLVNSINSLEMSALKQGTGFSAPIEAAPLDNSGELTFPPDAALTAKVEEELKTTKSDFSLLVNDYVAGFINYFTNSPAGHAHLVRSLERAGKYKDMISRVLKEEGVPQDLIYLAVTESGFQPQALNARSGAGGMWQFMPTGAYGLARNGWVDERFDPEKSSRAYAKYIKSLYNQFGDWYLAMAAYDWGPGYVQRSVMRTGYADYWELYRRNALPQETKNYVPGIIAAIIMAKNPKQYGLEGLVPEPPVTSDTVTVNYPVDLRLVADVTDVSLQEIVALNPSLLRMSTPQDTDFDLHLPAGTRDLYLKRIASVPEDKRTSWRFHVVKAGESLDSVANLFHSRGSEIARANQLDADASIEAGDELVVPIATVTYAARPQHYTTRSGDTLVTVADRFNVTVEELRRWNHLSSSNVRPGRMLAVSQPIRLAPVTHVRSRHGHSSTASVRSVASHSRSASKTRPQATSRASAKSASTSKHARKKK